MAKYELVVILDPFLEDAEHSARLDRVKEQISKRGGTVVNVDLWGKKRMAYPIQRRMEGYYAVITFEGKLEGNTLNEIERNVRLNESILREMVTRVPTLKPPKKVKVKKPKPAGTHAVDSYQGGERRQYHGTRSAGQAGAAAAGPDAEPSLE